MTKKEPMKPFVRNQGERQEYINHANIDGDECLDLIETEMHERGFWGAICTHDFRGMGECLTDEGAKEFLRHYTATGNLTASASAAGVTKWTIRNRAKADPTFGEAYEIAKEMFKEHLLSAMYNRGVKGWEEPVFGGRNRDEIVGHITKYSDKMLELLSRYHIPELRANPNVQVNTQNNLGSAGTGPGGQPINTNVSINLSLLDDDELDSLEPLLEKMANNAESEETQ